jgi:hypothetical protein
MSGVINGLDLGEAMASLPEQGLDRDFARRLFMTAEAVFVAAWLEANPQKN